MAAFHPTDTLRELQGTIQEVRDSVDEVIDHILVIQAEQDEMINPDSANVIYDEVMSDENEFLGTKNLVTSLLLIKKKKQYLKMFINF